MKRRNSAKALRPAPAEKHPGKAKSFLIAGVGASAGGLEAFRQLLQNLPSDTGMAFVLVQHLDPAHPSALTQLLSKATSMPVSEVTNLLRVKPDHVYIIAPNTAMAIDRGILKLQPRRPGPVGHRPIDFFFESLARDQRERAIGIILSGTASDGTIGLEAIKAEGGFTFAQDASAKYDSMPRSAVAAGCVDLVLSPEMIARELARISRHPYVATQPASQPDPGLASRKEEGTDLIRPLPGPSAFKKILLILRNHCGIDFSLYKVNTIHRRINRRIVLNKLTTLDDYAHFLRGNPAELNALFSDVLINVTGFFRNPEVFEVLKRSVFPALAKERSRPLRVWVAGCSTGQEAYSIAMAYLEYSERNPRAPGMQLFATDLHERMLEKARSGLYPKTTVEDVSSARLRRFFTEEQGGYRVIKPLRDMTIFARQNVLGDPPFSRIDLLSCRNLLIYIESSLQEKILPAFHYALQPNGFLLLGTSESVGSFTSLFQPVDKKHKIFSKKAVPTPPLSLHFAPRAPDGKKPTAEAGSLEAQEPRGPELITEREADRVTVFRYAPPGVLVDDELRVLRFRGDTSCCLKQPSGKGTFHLLRMAREGLISPLRAAISKVKKEHVAVRKENIKVAQNGQGETISLEVVPLKHLKQRFYLVFFEPGGMASATKIESRQKKPRPAAPLGKAAARRRISELEQELAEARDYLQSVNDQYEASNEELQASNEEITSANEELQSINEELETAKEELEATNEELTIVNEEMSHRNVDLGQLNADLINFQTSTNMAILLLGRDLTIRRFTAEAARQFNLLATDIGRPIAGIRHNLEVPDLEKLISEVIDNVKECEREVRNKNGRWRSLRIRPFFSFDKKLEGAVITVTDIDALKRNAQEITEAREYAEAIIRTTRDSLLVLEADLTVHSANEAFYQAFSLSPAQTEGRLIYELGDGQWNFPKLRELLEEIIPRNAFFTGFEVTHTFEKLGARTLLLSARMLNDPGGRPRRILLAIHDATERLLTEEAQESLAAVVEGSADAIISTDLNGIITHWNQGAEELYGYAKAEAVGRPVTFLVPAGYPDEELEILGRIRRGQSIDYSETIRQRKDGGLIDVSMSVSPLRNDLGQIIGASKIARDISERKQAEKQLLQRSREQQQLYRLAITLSQSPNLESIFDAALDAVLVCLEAQRAAILLFDQDLIMRFQAWRGLSQNYRQAVEGHSPWTPSTSDPQPVSIENVAEAPLPEALRLAVQAEGIGALCFIPLTFQGRLLGKFMVYYDSPHSFAEGEIQLGETIANQLAFGLERKKADEALREARDRLADQAAGLEHLVHDRTAQLTEINKQLQTFVYSIAHDLRAPLRGMQGFATMLLEEEGQALSMTGRDYAKRIGNAALFMDALLIDLLAFSRISQQQLHLAPVNLEAIAQSALSRLEREIQENNARVEMVGAWPGAVGHEPTLVQVFTNLVANALKFVAPGTVPLVRLRAEEIGEFVRVWVEDNGIGIAPEHQERIFRLFTRLAGQTFPGTGIGLAIVQKGIERMGGRVGVDSTPGQGSRFWFELRKV